MQGLASGQLDSGPGLERHLANCLGCRACEPVCPAGVPYGELIDAGRALLAERGLRPSRMQRLLAALLRHPRLLRLAIGMARLPGARALARRLGGPAGRAASLLPPDARAPRLAAKGKPVRSTAGEASSRGDVLLFTGCVSGAVDGRSLDDSRRALEAAGWRVRVPGNQQCCGAIDLHAGRPEAARRLALANVGAFAGDEPVVACASGCAATLEEYARLAGDAGARLGRRVRDPAELLADAKLQLSAGPWRDVVLHVPCTQRNVTGSADATRRLLAQLPGVSVRELPAGCCGAAGDMFLSNPTLSDALLEPLLKQLEHDPPDALVTSNIGCALHFKAGLARARLQVPVLHPSSLAVAALQSDL